jgi:hypothetical protein
MSRTRLYTKKELRIMAGISKNTFRRYMNDLYFTELQKLGYEKKQKILSPQQSKFLIEKLVITE